MWQIIKNEGQYLSRNKTLLGVSLGFLLTLCLSVFMGNLQINNQTERYEVAKNHVRQQWERIDAKNPHSAAHYGTYVFKPSSLLNSLDEGVNSVTGNVLRVEGHVQNEIVYSEASQMMAISKFGKLKSSLLLQYILPLLLIFLAFQSVSSEKQSGRMKILVLQGASPTSIVWAKAFSVWLYGLGLLTMTILFYAIYNWANITAETLSRTFYFYLVYSAYYFIISTLTVYFSARWQNTTALTSMLGIWIVWTIFLPNILMSSVEKWHELPSRNAFQSAMKEDRAKGIDGHNPKDERAKDLVQSVLKEYDVDSLAQLPINFDGLRMQADEEYGNKVWDKHFGNLRTVLEKQKRSYQLAGFINPFISLQSSSKGFTASDNLHHQEFLVQVENYRRVFIKRLNDEHAFGGSKTGDWGWKADNAFFKSVKDYDYKPVAISSVIPTYLMDFLILGFWIGLVSLLLSFASKKMEIV